MLILLILLILRHFGLLLGLEMFYFSLFWVFLGLNFVGAFDLSFEQFEVWIWANFDEFMVYFGNEPKLSPIIL